MPTAHFAAGLGGTCMLNSKMNKFEHVQGSQGQGHGVSHVGEGVVQDWGQRTVPCDLWLANGNIDSGHTETSHGQTE